MMIWDISDVCNKFCSSRHIRGAAVPTPGFDEEHDAVHRVGMLEMAHEKS